MIRFYKTLKGDGWKFIHRKGGWTDRYLVEDLEARGVDEIWYDEELLEIPEHIKKIIEEYNNKK